MSSDAQDAAEIGRRKPAHGVWIAPNEPTIVFLTVVTRSRLAWLTAPDIHSILLEVWAQADAWLVGRYVLMPDHLHLFCAPGPRELPLENWVRYWKSQCTRRLGDSSRRWQTDHWDTRLRRIESYDAKWEYIRQNPVRKGLASHIDEWPFQGELNILPWW